MVLALEKEEGLQRSSRRTLPKSNALKDFRVPFFDPIRPGRRASSSPSFAYKINCIYGRRESSGIVSKNEEGRKGRGRAKTVEMVRFVKAFLINFRLLDYLSICPARKMISTTTKHLVWDSQLFREGIRGMSFESFQPRSSWPSGLRDHSSLTIPPT